MAWWPCIIAFRKHIRDVHIWCAVRSQQELARTGPFITILVVLIRRRDSPGTFARPFEATEAFGRQRKGRWLLKRRDNKVSCVGELSSFDFYRVADRLG